MNAPFWKLPALSRYRAATSGATVIEYALIAAGISLLISAAVFGFGTDLADLFARFGDHFNPPS